MCYNEKEKEYDCTSSGASARLTDLVAKKIFSNPEITCQFIRDMLDLPAKKCDHFGGK